jgi:hypothetical protein
MLKGISLGLTGVLLVFGGVQTANAAPSTYKNCAAFNMKYPAGVARSIPEANAAFARYMEQPSVNTKAYAAARKANKKLGTPNDGVLCEVPRKVTTPSAPTALTSSDARTTSVYIQWNPPQSDGNAPITGYVVKGSGSHTVTGNKAYISGLQPGTAYTFEVVAVNIAGQGAPTSIGVSTVAEPVVVAPSAPPVSGATRYANCTAAKAAGVTPIRVGTPLYDANRHLDRDGDGIACE